MNSLGYSVVTWIGRGALILWALMAGVGLVTLGPAGALVNVVVFGIALGPVAAVCAAVRHRLGARLASPLVDAASDTPQQTQQ